MPVTACDGAPPSFTSFNQMDWTPYLKSIRCDSRYDLSRERFTPLDALDRRADAPAGSLFLLNLRVRTVLEATPELKERQEQKVERWDVLDGLRHHAAEHVLLIGRPGSGKSTALQRLLLEEAERALGDANACIPVLLELRHYQKSTLDLIGQALRTHGLMDLQRLPEWLQQGRLLLLVDGINELPSVVARRELAAFRREYRTTTPMIFTTRELMVGGDLEIGKRLVMEPLTEPQMQQFVRAYLGDDGNKLLRQLQGRLRELAEVPLLLWMLCSLFQETRERLPENMGLALRQFTTLYDRQLKGDAPVSDESRCWWPLLLQRLAFKMLEGPEPTELYVAIVCSQAEGWLTDYLREEQCSDPRGRAMEWLNDLVNHHLLQRSAGDRIEFRHQFIQEYYAAEYLLSRLPELDAVTLQRDYLNYLKWTEPFILLLGLLENRNQALQIVKLAEAIDWPLAARLAGAVHPDWQKESIRFIATTLQIPEWHQVQLYGLTRSQDAVPALEKILHHDDEALCETAAIALGHIGGEVAVNVLATALRGKNFKGFCFVVEALGQIGSKAAASILFTTACDPIIRSHKYSDLYYWTIDQALNRINGQATTNIPPTVSRNKNFRVYSFATANTQMQIGDEITVSTLVSVLHNEEDVSIRKAAVEALGQIGDESAVSTLLTLMHNKEEDIFVREVAIEALERIGNESAIRALYMALHEEPLFVRWVIVKALAQIGAAPLLAQLVPEFRQGIQNEKEIYTIISALQRRFKIYRADKLTRGSEANMSEPFDVFLSHNSKDKPAVRQLAEALKMRKLQVWLDEEQLIPGRPWQEALEEIIQTTHTAAVLIGKDGLGPWESPEMRACLSQFVDRKLPVIPVLLPDAPTKPELPLFLRAFTWVDLRGGLTDDGLDRLEWGITGRKP